MQNTQTQCEPHVEFLNFEPSGTQSNRELYKIKFALRGKEILASILNAIS